jgi:hypothetical protein
MALTNASGCDYLRSVAQFAPEDVGDDELFEKISDLHRTHCGMSPGDAEQEYLINASRLAMYGLDQHVVEVGLVRHRGLQSYFSPSPHCIVSMHACIKRSVPPKIEKTIVFCL